MSMIKAEGLTFSYPSGSDDVFTDVSFQLDSQWRLGLIGGNGKGKTTLLKLLLGNYKYRGKITGSVKFNYFPYEISDRSKLTREILDEVCPMAEDWEIAKELSLLGVNSEAVWQRFETLSKGEQTKVLLAALFLNGDNFLLIDEPTNHLDYTGRKSLSDYLSNKKGFILVSHDRSLLDACTDHILAINPASIEVCSGNFSTWFENFSRKQQFEEAENKKLKKDIKKLQQAAKRTSQWSYAVEKSKNGSKNSGSKIDKGYVGHKSAKMMKRSKSIEARQQSAIEEKSSLLKDSQQVFDLKIYPLKYHKSLLAEFSKVSAIYDGIQIFKPVSFEINTGDRIALMGKNGSGKSSLLKLLLSEDIDYQGTIYTGSGLKISYVSQDTSKIGGGLSDFSGENNIDESIFKALLRKMGFGEAQLEKDIKDFSQGQKKKVLLAKSLCSQAHLYIWDEPLNYVDIYSRIQIENLIKSFSPTMLFVEHDREFINSVATKKVEITSVR